MSKKGSNYKKAKTTLNFPAIGNYQGYCIQVEPLTAEMVSELVCYLL